MKRRLIEQLVSFYESFDADSINDLGSLYAPDVTFIDPIHRVDGLTALKSYFAHLCGGEGESRFQITDVIEGGFKSVGTDQQSTAFLRWQMTYNNPKLAGNEPLSLVGGSMVRFNECISYQEDFYDLGQMVYQHIPVLGWAVKKVKMHLANSSDSLKHVDGRFTDRQNQVGESTQPVSQSVDTQRSSL